MTKLRTIAILTIALYAGYGDAADSPYLSAGTTIVISADKASEEPGKDILHFTGHVDIKTPGWGITADKVTVYGQLDNLQRIVAEGSPVQFFFRDNNSKKKTLTQGEGLLLDYEKATSILRLSGKAKLTNGSRVMLSSEIQYDLELEKLEAAGPEGVHITIVPDGDGDGNL